MFRLWGKLWKDNHLLKDTVICDDSEDTRTHKIFRGLESICYEMDLGNPICKLCLNGMPVPLLRNCYSIFNGTKYR